MNYYGNNDFRGYHLAHHGILGMKWGKRNGPPYPLGAADHSASEKKAGWRKSLNNKSEKVNNKKDGGNEKAKKILKAVLITAGAVGVASLAAYGVYSYKNMDESLSALAYMKGLKKKGSIGDAKVFFDATHANKYNLKHLYEEDRITALDVYEKEAIELYTGGQGYKTLHGILRGTFDRSKLSVAEESYYDLITDRIKRVLNKCSLPQDAFVHRGVGDIEGAAKFIHAPKSFLETPEWAKRLLIGREFEDRSFVSAGGAVTDAFEGIKTHIFLPKGAKALYIDPISKNIGEHEFLIQMGSTFKIKDILFNSKGTVSDIFLELILK